jgi:hypothetical protein
MGGLGDLETMPKERAAEVRRVELERLDVVHLSLWERREILASLNTLLRLQTRV